MEEMLMSETFGQRLSRLRKEKGLTQEDIAKRIIISPQAVSKWENDLSSPDILVLSSLADILGVSVDTLLGREESSETETHQEEAQEDKKEENKEEDYEEASEVVDDDEVKRKKGIHIVDEDGSGIHITSDGIFAREKNGEHTKKVKINKHKHNEDENVFWITSGSLFGLALVAYLLMGFLWKDQAMGWKMGWICFLIAIVISSIVTCFRKKKFTSLNYPVLTVAAYCTLGFLGMYLGFNGWGTYWFLFLTIPAFYLIFTPIDRYIHRHDEKYHRFIEIDDDDDDEEEDDD